MEKRKKQKKQTKNIGDEIKKKRIQIKNHKNLRILKMRKRKQSIKDKINIFKHMVKYNIQEIK